MVVSSRDRRKTLTRPSVGIDDSATMLVQVSSVDYPRRWFRGCAPLQWQQVLSDVRQDPPWKTKKTKKRIFGGETIFSKMPEIDSCYCALYCRFCLIPERKHCYSQVKLMIEERGRNSYTVQRQLRIN